MRFGQLPIGRHFRIDDDDYRKVSPLEAVMEGTDARRLIPRSTKIETIDDGDPPHRPEPTIALTGHAVESALHHCVTKVEQQTKALSPALSHDHLVAVSNLLREAHAEAIARLGLHTMTQPDRTGNADGVPPGQTSRGEDSQ